MKRISEMTFDELMRYTLAAKRIEPFERVKDIDHVPRGCRNRTPKARHIWHTYQIINGISARQLIAENIISNNALLKLLKSRL